MDELLSPAAAPDESGAQFATVSEVLDDGVTLIFDGQDEATDKHYRCNTGVLLLAGDRVKVCKDSGTYVVEYVVGSPALRLLIPSGGASGQYLAKKGSDSYALKWVTGPTEHIPTGGTDGQYLAKNGTANYSLKWVTGPTEHIPTGGTDGQYLVKSGTANYSLKWATGPVSDTIKAGNTNFLTLNSNRQLVPSGASSYLAYSIGSPSAPFWSAYFGGGTLSLGTKDAKIGFWGTAPLARCTLSTTSQNMGYSSASASNYLTILNNIAGILKKYGLIT